MTYGIEDRPQAEPSGFYGPYRGVVTNTQDPAGQNRIKAIVPQLFGNTTTETDWALPCQLPGLQSVPPPGQGVWIMFEGGDLNYPVFMGMWQPEPAVAPYEVAGAGASAVAQAVAQSEAFSTAALNAYVPLASNPAGQLIAFAGTSVASSSNVQVQNLIATASGFLKGGMTTGTNSLIVPMAGAYAVMGAVAYGSIPGLSSPFTNCMLFKNGSEVFQAGQGQNQGWFPTVTASALIVCAVNDALTLWTQQDSGSTINTVANGGNTSWLSAFLVSV